MRKTVHGFQKNVLIEFCVKEMKNNLVHINYCFVVCVNSFDSNLTSQSFNPSASMASQYTSFHTSAKPIWSLIKILLCCIVCQTEMVF